MVSLGSIAYSLRYEEIRNDDENDYAATITVNGKSPYKFDHFV